MNSASAVNPVEVWGILNVTPDSFSDGGRYVDAGAAIAHARRMRARGAAVIDVGGESTRPGATPISPEIEQQRILPVVRELAREGIRVSVDTIHASTARAAIAEGASIINDVTAGEHDALMLKAVAETGAGLVLMHSRGLDVTRDTEYVDVVSEVAVHLRKRLSAALEAGVPRESVMLDPGFGFSKVPEDNWRLLAGLGRITRMAPTLVGTSRKRFLGTLLPDGAAPEERDAATAATSIFAAQAGARAVRVHDVTSSVQSLRALAAWADGQGKPRATGKPVSVSLTGVRAFGHHGVHDSERHDGQEFVIDAHLTLDAQDAVASDDIAATVHYGELAEAIVADVASRPVNLIETLAERLTELCMTHPQVEQATVTVHKPSAPITVPFGDVSVTAHRSRGRSTWSIVP